MKVALTVWENRISPVFDSAHMLLIAEIEDAETMNRRYESFNPEISLRLVEMLKQIDISVLICGAISEAPANIITGGGIELISFIAGNAEMTLEHFAKGEPLIPAFLMPGCGKRCRGKSKNESYFAKRKEVNNMPGTDKTGPQGQGAGTGKGRGGCKGGGQGGGSGQGGGAGQGQGGGAGQGQGGGAGQGQGGVGQGRGCGQGRGGRK